MCEQIGGFVHHHPERPDPDRELVSVAAGCRHSDDGGPIVTQPKPKG